MPEQQQPPEPTTTPEGLLQPPPETAATEQLLQSQTLPIEQQQPQDSKPTSGCLLLQSHGIQKEQQQLPEIMATPGRVLIHSQLPESSSAPGRFMLHSLLVQDIAEGKVICIPHSLTPSPSVSHICVCQMRTNRSVGSTITSDQSRESKPQQESQWSSGSSTPKYKDLDETALDPLPCCRTILRKLALEAESDFPVDKRVSIHDPQMQSDLSSDCCAPNMPPKIQQKICKPETSKKKKRRIPCIQSDPCFNRSAKKKFCCDMQDCKDAAKLLFDPTTSTASDKNAPCLQVKPIRNEDIPCTIDHCKASNKEKCYKRTSPQFDDPSHRLRAMPPTSPIPSRNSSGMPRCCLDSNLIPQEKSSTKTSGNLSYSKLIDCNCNKTDVLQACHCSIAEKTSKKGKKKKEKSKKNAALAEKKNKPMPFVGSCTNVKCKVNTCTCHFPPAYSQYFDCTGLISGNCQCDKNN